MLDYSIIDQKQTFRKSQYRKIFYEHPRVNLGELQINKIYH